jgi:hypothetical protein
MFNRRNFLKFIGISGLFGITATKALEITCVGVRKNQQVLWGEYADLYYLYFNDGTYSTYFLDETGSSWSSLYPLPVEEKERDFRYNLAQKYVEKFSTIEKNKITWSNHVFKST